MAFPGFPEQGVKFLAGLARHNDREWFQPRKALHDDAVKLPLTDLVAELTRDLARIAPLHVAGQPVTEVGCTPASGRRPGGVPLSAGILVTLP